jgi:hypothetical protein
MVHKWKEMGGGIREADKSVYSRNVFLNHILKEEVETEWKQRSESRLCSGQKGKNLSACL